jgi:GDPmannose 4,6-dehydratase
MIMSDSKCDDYVVATNKLNTVRYFFELASRYIGFIPTFEGEGSNEQCFDGKSGQLLCKVDQEFFREPDTKALRGDFSKIRRCLGWEPMTSFETLVELMSGHDLSRIKNNNEFLY